MNTRRAFTLVEILVVIAIICILVTLVTVAARGVFDTVKRARIGTQMSQIAMALDQYKAEFGEYPPDMFGDEALVRHVKKRWPRYELPDGDVPVRANFIKNAVNAAYGNNVNFFFFFSEVGSLALWLGGFPNVDGRFSGFCADPEDPFFSKQLYRPLKDWSFDRKVFVDLEAGEGKNVRYADFGDDCIVPVIGNEIRDVFVPFVYFRGLSSGGHRAYMVVDENRRDYGLIKRFTFPTAGFCVPYAEKVDSSNNITWKNPSTFQLLHPGQDGTFGEPTEPEGAPPLRNIQTGENIGLQNLDNITNFSGNKELKSIMP
jgi:prepilin-type N-terminal cleavage/methylation domain-containing protein